MNPVFDSLCTRLLATAIFLIFPVASYPANAPSMAVSGAKPNHAMPRDIKKPIESPLGSPNDKKVTNDACPPVAHAASAACGDAELCVLASSPATQSGAKSKPNDAGRIEVTLGDYIILRTPKPLCEYLAEQKDRTTNRLGLFLNRHFLKDVEPEAYPGDPYAAMFHLRRTTNNQDVWSIPFGNKSFHLDSETRTTPCVADITLAAGFEGGNLVSDSPACLEYFPDKNKLAAMFMLAFALLFIFVVCLLANRTSLLRDQGIPPPGCKTPWSLARVQMAFWTVSVVSAVLFIYAVTGDNPTIPNGILILMGLGGATAVSAFAIDTSQHPPGNRAEYEALLHAYRTQETNVKTAETSLVVAQAGGVTATVADAEQKLATATAASAAVRAKMKPYEAPAGTSFIYDILSDENGIAFHRLQLLVWTLVYGFMFIAAAWHAITLTNFTPEQMALMGISGATYLGFKLSEKPKDPGVGPQGSGVAPSPAPVPIASSAQVTPTSVPGGRTV